MNFRKAVREASREADLRFGQRLKLRIILMVPSYRQKLEDELLLKAIQHNAVPAATTLDGEVQDIDWNAVKEFIKEWLPVIIRIVLIFFMI